MKRSTVLLIVGLVVGLVLGWWLRRWHEVDRCLDHGGRWAYQAGYCEGATRY